MEIQVHPGSGRSTVRTLRLSRWMEIASLAGAAVGAILAVSLWLTVPVAASRRLHLERQDEVESGSVRLLETRRAAIARGGVLRARALAAGDLLNRLAFLYGVAPERWPRGLDPDVSLLPPPAPEDLPDRLEGFHRALERGLAILAAREREDPDLADRCPAVLPVDAPVYAPASLFGPGVSPWTGKEEFFQGIELAAPAGSPVIASGGGTVLFAGRIRPSPGRWLWRLGNLVVLSHGEQGATLYGHLSRIDARRGQRVRRGEVLGRVGSTGWAMSPQLHYEFWRSDGASLRPTDPLFAILDRRIEPQPVSLGRMLGTSAPGPIEPLPGL
jgi:murein DD-endopeptidase MepM/ murein hydrolase activator NlpD